MIGTKKEEVERMVVPGNYLAPDYEHLRYETSNTYNGKECKHIRAHNFPFYQSQGWKIGRLRKGEKKDAD